MITIPVLAQDRFGESDRPSIAFAHFGGAGRQPHFGLRRDRDDNTTRTERIRRPSTASSTAASTRRRVVPQGRSISVPSGS